MRARDNDLGKSVLPIIFLVSSIFGMDDHKNNPVTLACLAARCLAHETDFLVSPQLADLPPAVEPCLKEVILRELIAPFILPVTLTDSRNQDSIIHNGICGLQGMPATSDQFVSVACDGQIVFGNRANLIEGTVCQTSISMGSLAIARTGLPQIFLGGYSGRLLEFDYAKKMIVRDMSAHGATINQISVNERFLVSCSNDKTIKLWERDSLQEVLSFQGKEAVHGVGFINSTRLASGSSDQSVGIWDIVSKKCVGSYQFGPGVRVWSLGILPRKEIIVGGLNTGMLGFIDANTGRLIRQCKAHESVVSSLVCHSDEQHIVTGSWDTGVKMWDVRMRACAAILAAHTDWVQQVTFLEPSDEILSGARDHMIRLWDVRMLKALSRFSLGRLVAVEGQVNGAPLVGNDARLAFLKRVTT